MTEHQNTPKDVAIRIRHRRKAIGLTQEQLATRVGCTRPHVCMVECGRGLSHLPTLYAWARALQCNPGWLAGFNDDPEPRAGPDPQDRQPELPGVTP